jgi:hypothetical protein
VPGNLSIRDCDIPGYYECYDRVQFKSGIEPSTKSGYTYMNPQVAENSFANEFQKFKCTDSPCGTVYSSTDPRLIDVPRAQVIPLDRPPYDDTVRLDEVYTKPGLTTYGKGYKTYSDINAGQISYYTDKSQEDAFFEPNFTTSARMVGTLYKDPMGAMKPQYDRFPLKCTDYMNTKKDNYDGCLSWIQDTQFHRQDMLALQMRKRNEQRWQPRWTGLNNQTQ